MTFYLHTATATSAFRMIVRSDGSTEWVEMTPEEIREADEAARAHEVARVAAGGCPHPSDEWEHDYDPESLLGDAYYCGRCGELMQVG